MSGDAFKRAQPGGKLQIPAAAWNACLDAAEAHRSGQNGPGVVGNRQFRQADIVLVKNSSGSDVGRFGVLGVSGVVFSPTDSLSTFQNQVLLTGVTPTTADHKGKFLVCLDPIAKGKVGRAWISGVCQVQVDITDAAASFCDVKNSDLTKLASNASGSARILYREGSGTGVKWCVVRLGDGDGGSTLRIGQFSGQWPNEPMGGMANVRPVRLFVKSDSANPTEWEPETDENGDDVLAVTINLFAHIPTQAAGDTILWCAVVPISDLPGEYDTGQVTVDPETLAESPVMQPYDRLWLLLAAEC